MTSKSFGSKSYWSWSAKFRRYALIIGFTWTFAVSLSFLWNYYADKTRTFHEIHEVARAQFERDVLYRRWNASHGGVYVPSTGTTHPNQYLTEVEERDILSPSGQQLTLMNPAYMTRQVHELGKMTEGVYGHITSLNPIRPENAPDDWEIQALESFEQGATEIAAVETIAGGSFYRFMRPLVTEEGCLKCHAQQGYQLGDIRGGISVSVPMAHYIATMYNSLLTMGISHGILWLLAIIALTFSVHHLRRQVVKRDELDQIIQSNEINFRTFFNAVDNFHFILDDQGKIREVNQTVTNRLGYTEAELTGQPVLMVHPEDRREEAGQIIASMLKGERKSCPIPLITKDGKQIPVETYVSLGEWYGEPAIFGVSKDISDLKQSEEKFAKAFHVNPAIAGLSDMETGEYIEVNKTFYDKLGFSPEEVIGKKAAEVVKLDPRFRETVIKKLQKDNKVTNVETIIYTKNGAPLNFLLSAEIVEIGNKKYNYTTGVDITDLRKAEKAQKESEERLELFFAQSLDGFFFMMLDEPVEWNDNIDKEKALDYIFAHQRITKVNDAMLAQYKATRNQFINLTPNDFFEHDLEAGKKVWREFFDAGRIHIDTKEKRFDGSDMIVEGDYICLYDRENRITGHFGIQRDVTERRRKDNELKKKQYYLEKAQDIGNIGTWEMNIADRTSIWTDEVFRIFEQPVTKKTTYDQFISYVHPDDCDYVNEKWQAALDGDSYDIEHRIIVKDKVKWVREKADIEYDGNGTAIRAIGVTQDISHYKDVEQELAKLGIALYQSPASVVITDLSGNIEYVNPKFEQLTGYSKDEVIGKNPRVLKSGESPPDFYKELWDTITSGKEWRGEFHNIKKNGEFYWELASISPIINHKGEIVNFVAVKEDITERRRLEDQQRHANRLEAITKLTGGIAHDFNNILGSIIGSADMLDMQTPENSPQHQFTKIIVDKSQQAANLVSQMLAYSRQQMLQPIPLELNDVIDDLTDQIKKIIGGKINLELKLTEDLMPIKADKKAIDQIIINLCDNAVSAIDGGGSITLTTRNIEPADELKDRFKNLDDGRYVLLSVTDTGAGINPEHMDKIYDPFFTTRDVGEGSGLGLSMVHGLVKQHHGHIRCDSEPGNGTTFELLFPASNSIG